MDVKAAAAAAVVGEIDVTVLEENGKETEEEKQWNRELLRLSRTYSHRVPVQSIYRGLVLNKSVNRKGIDTVCKARLRPDDCLVCGYPKSGTTWLEEVVYLIQHDGDIDLAKSQPVYLRAPQFEDVRVQTYIETKMSSPRTLKTHILPEMLPENHSSCKLVYIMRNPKDVAVSYFYFYKSLSELGSYIGSWEEFLSMFMSGYVVLGDWFRHINAWFREKSQNPNLLIVTFEQMKADPVRLIQKICTFLKGSEEALSSETIQNIVKHTDFKAMKSNPSTNFANIKTMSLPFMRKGQSGDWKNHFTVEQNEKFDALIKEQLKDPELLEFLFPN